MKKFTGLMLIVGMVSCLSAFGADLVKISGSTTNQLGYVQPSKEQAEKELDLELKISGGGSSHGMKLLIAGKIDVGMASRPLKEKEVAAGVVGYVAAWDAIAVIVHKSNSVDSLTLQQLQDIHTGKIKNWKEVGGNDQKIVVVTSHVGSATRDMFQKIAMSKEPYVKGAIEVKTTRLEVEKVGRFKGGIGAVSLVFVDPEKVKVIKVAGVAPEPKNVIDKSYPIARPLVLGTMGEAKGNAKKYIDWIMGPKGQEWIAKKFISVSKKEK